MALTIAAALQDAELRRQLLNEVRDRNANPAGADIQDCDRPGLAADIVLAGTRRVGTRAEDLCAMLRAYKGMVLYINADLISRWGGEAPIVTAIADPNLPRPAFFGGYRGDGSLVLLPGDALPNGLVVVVLPMPHSGSVYASTPTTTRVQVRADDVLPESGAST